MLKEMYGVNQTIRQKLIKMCWFDIGWRSKKYNVKVMGNCQLCHDEELYGIIIIQGTIG